MLSIDVKVNVYVVSIESIVIIVIGDCTVVAIGVVVKSVVMGHVKREVVLLEVAGIVPVVRIINVVMRDLVMNLIVGIRGIIGCIGVDKHDAVEVGVVQCDFIRLVIVGDDGGINVVIRHGESVGEDSVPHGWVQGIHW